MAMLWNIYDAWYKNIMSDVQSEANTYKNTAKTVATTIAQNAPVTGDINDVNQFVRWKDLYTWENVSWVDRALSAGAMFIPWINWSEFRSWWSFVLGFSKDQLGNLKRFIDKIPSNSKSSIEISKNGNLITMRATSPWNVPWSKAVYEKVMDAWWKTIQYLKTTFDPNWNIVHIKDKLTGKTINSNK